MDLSSKYGTTAVDSTWVQYLWSDGAILERSDRSNSAPLRSTDFSGVRSIRSEKNYPDFEPWIQQIRKNWLLKKTYVW